MTRPGEIHHRRHHLSYYFFDHIQLLYHNRRMEGHLDLSLVLPTTSPSYRWTTPGAITCRTWKTWRKMSSWGSTKIWIPQMNIRENRLPCSRDSWIKCAWIPSFRCGKVLRHLKLLHKPPKNNWGEHFFSTRRTKYFSWNLRADRRCITEWLLLWRDQPPTRKETSLK